MATLNDVTAACCSRAVARDNIMERQSVSVGAAVLAFVAGVVSVSRHRGLLVPAIARRFDGANENAGFNAIVQRIAGIYP